MKEFGEVSPPEAVPNCLGIRCLDNWYGIDISSLLILTGLGGYYGEGKRGGRHSTFLCGLRVEGDPPPMKYLHLTCPLNAE
jgi:hypothetical protein